ncbi:hypothetical protein SteCoe_15225 [Stentor coeruleus]|uniref:ISXO2-like transposase domain-containing protein n=1 Tax=Stentor coeruleus TaxID=5963 RepID=A0A1R2C458_9CILI|nr:hypothetical protein SteCoe_15225 [Stentor coeruleus]
MIRVCEEHGEEIMRCSCCFDLVTSAALFSSDEAKLEKAVEVVSEMKQNLIDEKKELLASLATIKEKMYLKNPILPKNYIRDSRLLEYIMNMNIPLNILTIIYDPEFSLAFLFQKGILKSKHLCKCQAECQLKRQGKHFFFVCDCGNVEHITKGSFWEKYELPPSKIVLTLFLWVMNITSANIAQLLTLTAEITNPVTEKLREIISAEYLNTLPKFRGVVEIDESCFKSGRDKNQRYLQDRWVFGLYERERKLVYMQVVQKRDAKTLIPIIQERCELGTTIISDQWYAYNKLAEFGYPHYTVDHSRFFVNPNSREIHTQDIEISWCWAKYNVKKHRNTVNLQHLLNVFCWMRQFKKKEKGTELASVLNAASEIISRYEEKVVKT